MGDGGLCAGEVSHSCAGRMDDGCSGPWIAAPVGGVVRDSYSVVGWLSVNGLSVRPSLSISNLIKGVCGGRACVVVPEG